MKTEYTERGFAIVRFIDEKGVSCSIQKSSLATNDCIWLGASDIGLKRFEPYIGWSDVQLPDGGQRSITYIANNRMHLDQEQVKALLPYLQYFAEHGELPPHDDVATHAKEGN